MSVDIRSGIARYYDLDPVPFDDIPFYLKEIPSPEVSILELGCGTGRVLIPLTKVCGYVHGIDSSEAMLAICERKLKEAGVSSQKASVSIGDIINLENLGRAFELIIAPYHVFQNLETDLEVEGFFKTVRNHLASGGSCIINTFNTDPEILKKLQTGAENFDWEAKDGPYQITCSSWLRKIDLEKPTLYLDAIYRRYSAENLEEEVVGQIVLRCYYPNQLTEIIESHGFKVMGAWGGYSGEKYGEGSELVVKFGHVS